MEIKITTTEHLKGKFAREHDWKPHKFMWYPNWLQKLFGKKPELRWVYPGQYRCDRCGMVGLDIFGIGGPAVMDVATGTKDPEHCIPLD